MCHPPPGRPHAPHTEAMIVKSIERGSAGYLRECAPGEPGMLVCRGGNLMSGYIGLPEAATAKVIDRAAGGWYTNLGDVCFYLPSPPSGNEPAGAAKEFYWRSRDSALLIRGGANYAYEQINAELRAWATQHFALPTEGGVAPLDVAVVGLRVASEHEDACCVTVELVTPAAQAARAAIEEGFLKAAGAKTGGVSKGAKPDHLRVAPIPRNFKGAVQLPDLVAEYKAHLGLGGPPKAAAAAATAPPATAATAYLFPKIWLAKWRPANSSGIFFLPGIYRSLFAI